MKHLAKPYLYEALVTGLIFMVINLVGFAFHWLTNTPEGDWNVLFKHGTLYLNDVATGLVWGETSASITLTVVYLVSFYLFRMKWKRTAAA